MMVPHYRPSFSEKELKAVQTVIASGYIAQNGQVLQLESVLSGFVGKKFGIAVSSGTSALILALKALQIKPGDEVIIPSYTCSALWHAVKAVNAVPIFADIETESYNLDSADVKNRISHKTKAVIFPHMFGQPGYIQEVVSLGIPLIEDIAQAIGATINNRPVGSFGAISIVSFYATKVIGAGEGGMLFTDEPAADSYLRDLREYDEKDNLIPRMNAKMSDLTAAIALSQFKKLPEFTEIRRRILEEYKNILGEYMILPAQNPNLRSNLFRCVAIHPDHNADQLIQTAKAEEVNVRKPVFKPLHSYLPGITLKNTEDAWQKQISIPLFPDLNASEIETVLNFLQKIMGNHND
ncbi:MAG TPA: DegT/DnrJ/EryC1/StrS family aminotransferase [Candidatus Marinimicrobia bacterium]|nr:DegT/DnrJ/EryC1/StrS family aminotransferase [Candidatus Neomarinimicrobiota bacterium]